ncbi:MAG: FAD-dependent oxidoreductase [Sphingomonadaceae bacterium]
MSGERFAPSRAFPSEEVEHWDLETDVVVVGFGISGACAAIEARAGGADVLIFEVAAGAGGSTEQSGGEFYLGGGTEVQKAAGFDDTPEDFRTYLMMSGGPGVDEERVELYARSGLEHYQWLKDQGVPFKGTYLPGKWPEPPTDDTLIWCGSEAAWPFCEAAKPAPRGHTAQAVGRGGGKAVMDALSTRALAVGARAHFSTRVLCLVADRDGAVQGIVARIDGKPAFVRARKGVVLTTGGFIANEEMVAQYAPQVRTLNAMPLTGGNDDGSGIRMGMSVGGAVTHMEQFFATRTTFPPESLVKGVFVNERGQRFINEDAYHGRIAQYCIRQPGGRTWMLLDNATFGRPQAFPDVRIAAVGETWAEVEQELGLPEGELQHTMDSYNSHAAEGTDPLLHKQAEWLQPLVEAPFAALSFANEDYPPVAFTLGGLVTRPSGEVLDAAGAPIPGLFAAGRAACGIPRWGEGYSSGTSLGDSSFFGRQAGKSAAA